MATLAWVDRELACGGLPDESPEQVRSANQPFLVSHSNEHRLGAIQCLLGSGSLDGCSAGGAASVGGPLTEVARDEDVELGSVGADPAVFVTGRAAASAGEAEFDEYLGELKQHRRVPADVQHGIQIGRGASGGVSAFDAVQVRELASDQGPALRDAARDLE